ncbi:MAG: Co2+/Mg2+ efflux protein ApaG [Cellvibrionaceae bacterium]|nr:Co2+/Mg2+ efflux protein ApaG [Cellvibrionaceae bacterium]MCV6624453.1 Co2+/Mg2+ efflux protein ApaG [Cellvibrionaceae bacterium]
MSEIEVTAEPEFIQAQSRPAEGRFVYSYTIHITNRGKQGAQLLSRQWRILDTNDQLQEVEGIGVIGEQPHLEPGQTFSYSSGVIIATPTGTMEGSYLMKRDDGSQFEAPIGTFALLPPGALH